jgi:hypothetical protein
MIVEIDEIYKINQKNISYIFQQVISAELLTWGQPISQACFHNLYQYAKIEL